jgi:hypothetical protein
MTTTGPATRTPPAPLASLADLSPRSPLRPADWRWRRAVALHARRLRLRPREDPWTARAVRFLRRADRLGDPAHPGLFRFDPAVAGADRLRRRGDPRLLLEVEARLLAGEPCEAVAAACSLDPAAVAVFEQLFFAVSDQLEARDYINFVAIGYRPADPDPAALIKALAYHGGRHAVGPVLHALGVRDAPPGSEPGPGLVRQIRVAADTMCLRSGAASPAAVLRLHALMREHEREAAGRSAAAVCGPVAAALEPWPVPAPLGHPDAAVTRDRPAARPPPAAAPEFAA